MHGKTVKIHHQCCEILKPYDMLVHWVMKMKKKFKDICVDSITEFGVTRL